jgi:predicted porin
MKKTLLALTMALASLTASADPAGWTSVTTYDYDKASGSGAYFSQHTAKTGLAYGTEYGTFDGFGVYRQAVSSWRDNQGGFEVGYSNGLKWQGATFRGRVALGQIYDVESPWTTDTSSSYYSLGAEAGYPIDEQVSAFVGWRYTDQLNSNQAAANRFSVGADFKLDKNMALRVGYAYTNANTNASTGPYTPNGMNGFTSAFVYKF